MLSALNTLVGYPIHEMCFIPTNVGPTRLNSSMVFVTVFVGSDGSTFRLVKSSDSVISFVTIIMTYTSEANK